jgi:hypothetical protein
MLANKDNVVDYKLSHMGQKPTICAGLSFLYTQELVWVQTGFCLTRTTQEYHIEDHENRTDAYLNDTQVSVTLPILAGALIKDVVRIGAGPIFQRSLDSNRPLLEFKSFQLSNKDLVNSGFQMLIGTHIKEHLYIDLIYVQGLNKTAEDYTYLDEKILFKGRTRSLTLALSVFL